MSTPSIIARIRHIYATNKHAPIIMQFVLYLFVGGFCSLCDVGSFYLLDKWGVSLILASAFSFSFATLINYFLCYHFVFTRGRFSIKGELARVFSVSLVGLGLNTLIVYLFVTFLDMNGVFAKITAIPIVLIWNFMGRRLLVFHKSIPNMETGVQP